MKTYNLGTNLQPADKQLGRIVVWVSLQQFRHRGVVMTLRVKPEGTGKGETKTEEGMEEGSAFVGRDGGRRTKKVGQNNK